MAVPTKVAMCIAVMCVGTVLIIYHTFVQVLRLRRKHIYASKQARDRSRPLLSLAIALYGAGMVGIHFYRHKQLTTSDLISLGSGALATVGFSRLALLFDLYPSQYYSDDGSVEKDQPEARTMFKNPLFLASILALVVALRNVISESCTAMAKGFAETSLPDQLAWSGMVFAQVLHFHNGVISRRLVTDQVFVSKAAKSRILFRTVLTAMIQWTCFIVHGYITESAVNTCDNVMLGFGIGMVLVCFGIRKIPYYDENGEIVGRVESVEEPADMEAAVESKEPYAVESKQTTESA